MRHCYNCKRKPARRHRLFGMEDPECDALLGKVHTLERQLAQVTSCCASSWIDVVAALYGDAMSGCRLSERRLTLNEKVR